MRTIKTEVGWDKAMVTSQRRYVLIYLHQVPCS